MRLGRQVLAGPFADAGLLPASYYRHLVLTALEAEDFPGALDYLKWADDPLLAQILVLRLRLLAGRHTKQRQAILDLMDSASPGATQEKCQALLSAEDRALGLLGEYEGKALALLSRSCPPSN